MLENALMDCRMDWKATGFSQDQMINGFMNVVKNAAEKDPVVSEKYKCLVEILGKHPFWEKQPIMNLRQKNTKCGMIKQFTPDMISKEPVTLNEGFEWSNIDISDDLAVAELCIFLNGHYIEDDDGKVKIYYSPDAVKYALNTPGKIPALHFCVRNRETTRIMACIMGTPKKIVINKETVKVADANFLAVHKSLRGKKMAQILIQEMMRRSRLAGR